MNAVVGKRLLAVAVGRCLDGAVPRLGRGRALDPELVLAVRAVHLVDDAARTAGEGGFATTPPRAVEPAEGVFGGWVTVVVWHDRRRAVPV
jgi:hypothetical protein